MNVVCLDLEGVLVPEIWIAFAEEAGIPELKRTTRDEPDYDKLMKWRLDILAEHGLGLPDVQAVIAKIDPMPGAKEFLDELRSFCQVIIISDIFSQFAGPLMKKLGIEYHDCHCVGTIIHMAVDGQYAGHIVISDVVKPHSKEAIEQLKRAGVQKTVMLTGDAKRVADNVAAELGVDEVRSELLPGDKVAEVEKLLAAKGKNDMLAFVGDGINDAPVLTRADIGIAMGAMGSDAAIEAADIVLMDDDPLQIAKAIKISRKCIGIVRQNIVFSLVVKFGCLALVAFGVANMWAAIFADVGVMVLAVLNAIRALKYKG